MAEKYKHVAVGGTDIQVLLEFPTLITDDNPAVLHMASALTVSYSVHRAKTPVYTLGQPVLDGFGIGKKYVAGTIITIAWDIDEISDFLDKNVANASAKERSKNQNYGEVVNSSVSVIDDKNISFKRFHTVMRDDLTPFNIHLIMSDENYGDERIRRIIIYGANFINNGQVMSIEDIVTENTISFIGQEIREQHDPRQGLETLRSVEGSVLKASQLQDNDN